MKLSRRHFVALGGGAAALASSGCDERDALFRWMGKPAAPLLDKPAAIPQGATLDPIAHALNRLTFGPRPDDYGRSSLTIPARSSPIEAQPTNVEPGGSTRCSPSTSERAPGCTKRSR